MKSRKKLVELIESIKANKKDSESSSSSSSSYPSLSSIQKEDDNLEKEPEQKDRFLESLRQDERLNEMFDESIENQIKEIEEEVHQPSISLG